MERSLANTQFSASTREKMPLLSDRFLKRVSIWVSVLALTTLAINIAGQRYSQTITKGSHTAQTTPVDVFVGPDHLQLPINAIRFPEQRVTGEAESVNLYLTWPALEGYSDDNQALFNNIAGNNALIFVQISQATMTLDMSGRLGPIYSRLFDGSAEPGPQGLAMHRFKESSGYGNEVMLTGNGDDGARFAIRCLLPDVDRQQNGADCQRDISAGTDLSVLYRYSSSMLKDWRSIDAALKAYIAAHVVADDRETKVNTRMDRISR